MELSRFAVAVSAHDERTIVYSTSTQSMALLDRRYGDDWADALNAEGGLTGRESDLLSRMGILVSSREDELGELSLRYRRDSKSREALTLMIAPTLSCNLRCPYCYEREVEHPGIMSEHVQDALCEKTRALLDAGGYHKLKVGWYGGEPLLGIDVIERLTSRFTKMDIPYEATMISNLTLADDTMVERICACGIATVTTTLDGIGPSHDAHRPARNGASTYERILHAIDSLSARGISVTCLYNIDKTTLPQFKELKGIFEERYTQRAGSAAGASVAADPSSPDLPRQERHAPVTLTAAQLFDYLHSHGQGNGFDAPMYDLIDDPSMVARLEYHGIRDKLTAVGSPMSDSAFATMLSPIRIFCGRQLDSYLVVDERGNLYECDGDIGYLDRAIGSLDSPGLAAGELPARSEYDPTEDPECEDCAFLPICMGNCRWTRNCCGTTCIPWKWVIGEVLRDWIHAIGEPLASVGSVHVMRMSAAPATDMPYEIWS